MRKDDILNKKGFTLVELIAVLSILALVLVLVTPNITNVANRSYKVLRNSKIDTVRIAGEKYGNAHINRYYMCLSGSSVQHLKDNCTVTIQDLTMSGAIPPDDEEYHIVDPETKVPLSGEILLCYNRKNIEVSAKYVINDIEYVCN